MLHIALELLIKTTAPIRERPFALILITDDYLRFPRKESALAFAPLWMTKVLGWVLLEKYM